MNIRIFASLALASLCVVWAAGEPELAVPGKVIFQSDFSKIETNWFTKVGTWTAKDGVLTGVERAEQKHGAVCRFPLPFTNALISFEYRLTGGKSASLSINSAKGHQARLNILPTGVQSRKDDSDHGGPDQAMAFNIISNIDGKTWQRVEFAMVGEWLWCRVGGQLSFGRDASFAQGKANCGFTVAGDGAEFKNLSVCEATPNPAWEAAAEGLRAKYPLPPAATPKPAAKKAAAKKPAE